MIGSLLGSYTFRYAKTLVYMLQATEYDPFAYFKWLLRVKDYRKVMYRRQLVMTRPAKMLLLLIGGGMILQELAAIIWLVMLVGDPVSRQLPAALVVLVSTPLVWSLLAILPLLLGRWFIVAPITKVEVIKSKKTFAKHEALKIAVAGSYGKTTMKEILLTVLSQGKKVAATPANRNVARSHAQFAKALQGGEEVLIVEFGEGAPGDVTKFGRTVKPDIGIITGIAPAHLDKYKTLDAAAKDIFSLSNFVSPNSLYVNEESEAAQPFIKDKFQTYNSMGIAGWKISEIKTGINGTSFEMTKGSQKLSLKSQLIGKHLVGTLAAAAAIAQKLGLSPEHIQSGIAAVKPFEHRMQPRQSGGAWIIDDTYNGNIEGMKAGLELLKELKAKRKIYITPGLVDQGSESAAIHEDLGKAIAAAKPDVTVLMKHSVTDDIERGLKASNYSGKLLIQDDPLDFYNHMDQFIAAGDLVLMQNDWPDNYN